MSNPEAVRKVIIDNGIPESELPGILEIIPVWMPKRIKKKTSKFKDDQWKLFYQAIDEVKSKPLKKISLAIGNGKPLRLEHPAILNAFHKMFELYEAYDWRRERDVLRNIDIYGDVIHSHNIKRLRAHLKKLLPKQKDRKINIITYTILQNSNLLPYASTENAMNAFIKKHV